MKRILAALLLGPLLALAQSLPTPALNGANIQYPAQSASTVACLDGAKKLTTNCAAAAGDLSGTSVLATGASASRRIADTFGDRFNIKDFGAREDVLNYSGCTMTASSADLLCTAASFTSADVGKAVSVAGAGASGATLVSTIASVSSGTTVTLAATASTTTPTRSTVSGWRAARGSGYVPGDTVTVAGGTGTAATVFTVRSTSLVGATINAAGSGGFTGTCVLTGTTGTGPKFVASGTVAGGVLTSVDSITTPGLYSVNPTSLASEPVTTNCGLVGTTLALTMGIEIVDITTPGSYSVVPTNPASQASTSGAGSGATFTLTTFLSGQAFVGTDDTAAWNAAIAAANAAFSSGQNRKCIYMPAGVSWVSSSLTRFVGPGCVLGDGGDMKSIIRVSPALSGDVLQWSENWGQIFHPVGGNTVQLNGERDGPRVHGIAIIGDRSTPNVQNALVFYDRNDFVSLDDITIYYIKGRAIYSGGLRDVSQAYMRESTLRKLRIFHSGDTGVAAVEFSSVGGASADGTNEIVIDGLDIFGPWGTGLLIRNNDASGVRQFRISNLRIEGLPFGVGNVQADLLQIGDDTWTGNVNSLNFKNVELLNPYPGRAALRMTAPSGAAQPYQVGFDGFIGGGIPYGKGVRVDAGRNSRFDLRGLLTYDSNIKVAASALVGGSLVFNDFASGRNWTYDVDASSVNAIGLYAMRWGPSGTFGTSLTNNRHDGSGAGGNAPASGAVDLQTVRLSANQTAAAGASAIVGGSTNIVNGTQAGILAGLANVITGGGSNAGIVGGNSNSLSGTSGFIGGGQFATDRGRYSSQSFSAGRFSSTGDSQASVHVLRGSGSGTSAFRLTADAAAAGSANCVNIPDGAAFALTVDVVALDFTSVLTNEAWVGWTMLLTRGAGAGATLISTSALPARLSNGVVTGSTVTATADTTNGCLNLSFTPPNGNADVWHATAWVRAVEVQ